MSWLSDYDYRGEEERKRAILTVLFFGVMLSPLVFAYFYTGSHPVQETKSLWQIKQEAEERSSWNRMMDINMPGFRADSAKLDRLSEEREIAERRGDRSKVELLDRQIQQLKEKWRVFQQVGRPPNKSGSSPSCSARPGRIVSYDTTVRTRRLPALTPVGGE